MHLRNKVMFETTHKLSFETAPWEIGFLLSAKNTILRFRVGSCEGIYETTDKHYVIIAIDNKINGNGHFEDVLEWFENSCKRDKKGLAFAEILNDRFYNHLKSKRGFKGNKQLLTKNFKP